MNSDLNQRNFLVGCSTVVAIVFIIAASITTYYSIKLFDNVPPTQVSVTATTR
jgi:hypothetical protein